MRSLKIPIFFQPWDKPYCGPACIKMVLSFYGIKISLANLVRMLPVNKTGISSYSIKIFLMNLGFIITFIGKDFLKISSIRRALAKGYPVILNIENEDGNGHFVVIRNIGKKRITINDPAYGIKILNIKKIISACYNWDGGAIIVRPNHKFKN